MRNFPYGDRRMHMGMLKCSHMGIPVRIMKLCAYRTGSNPHPDTILFC